MATLDFEIFKYFHVTKNNRGLTLFLISSLFLKQVQNLSKTNAMHAIIKTKDLFLFSKLWDVTRGMMEFQIHHLSHALTFCVIQGSLMISCSLSRGFV